MARMMMVMGLVLLLQGCVITKVVTVPMRVTGAVISIVPGVGNIIDSSIDTAADVVDDVPL